MSIVTLGAMYGSTSLVSDVAGVPRFIIRCVRGLDDSPRVRGEDTVVPGASGKIPRNRVYDGRVIELAGEVMGVGASEDAQRADIRAALESLKALFYPTNAPAQLVVTLEDGGTATISARPITMMVGPDTVPTWRSVSIELEAVEADWTIEPAGS